MPDITTDSIAQTAANPLALERNPLLQGLQCLRCAAPYPLALSHDGCPACAAEGVYVSLRARYRKRAGQATYLPYLQANNQRTVLGEGNTPLKTETALAESLGLASLHIKNESHNPTGSHKDRMSALGVAQALDFGAHTVVLASSGNAAVSAALYARAAGLVCEVATYEGMPAAYARRLDASGAKRFVFADNAGRWAHVAQRAATPGFFALTNHHLPALGSAPLAIEAYKAIAYECQASGHQPDHVFVPTARGDLAWGIHAGFCDLLEAGLISVLPKIWAVEPFARLSGVLAGSGLHAVYPGSTAQFSTAGGTVTYLQWQAVTESGGGAVVVPDAAARQTRALLAQHGYSAELCAAAGLAAVAQLRQAGTLQAQDKALLILTANASCDPSWPDTADAAHIADTAQVGAA